MCRGEVNFGQLEIAIPEKRTFYPLWMNIEDKHTYESYKSASTEAKRVVLVPKKERDYLQCVPSDI